MKSATYRLFTLLSSLLILACLCGEAIFQSSAQTRKRPSRTTAKRKAPVRKPAAKPQPEQAAKPATPAWEAWTELPPGAATQAARTDQPGEAAEFFNFKRAPAGSNELPMERYLAARAWLEEMPQYSSVEARPLPARKALRASRAQQLPGGWTFLGPGNVGGRTRALLIHPNDPSIMYAAGVAGGVWKSTNAGAGWTPLNDLLPNLAVCALAMAPDNPEVLYAGTGEGFFNSDGQRGAGIFKTVDGGANWTYLSNTATPDFYAVNKLVVSKNDSQRVYAATRTGVWRSLDGGGTWTRVHNPNINGGCLDLVIRTDKTTDYLFASCGTAAGVATALQASIYRNTDAAGAGTWDVVQQAAGMGRTTLALAPSNQDIIYALAASNSTQAERHGMHAVYRSVNSGEPGSWMTQARNTDANKLNTLLLTNPLIATLGDCNAGATNNFLHQGWYDNVIAVDPTDPQRVWAGGIDLFRSDDGGVNWGVASYWNSGPPNVLTLQPAYAHADQHALVFHPQYDGVNNKTLFIGNDGGLFRTDDARAPVATGPRATCSPANSAVIFTPLNNGYGVTQFYHGAVYPDGAGYFGGTQDNGTVRGFDTMGANDWRPIRGGDGGYVALDPGNPNTLYAENTGLSLAKSTTNGQRYLGATQGITNAGFMFITPFTMDVSDANRLLIGGSLIWRTTLGAASWLQASSTLAGGSVSALAIAPTDANTQLVGTSAGFIHRTNAGLTADSTTIWPSTRPRLGLVSWVTFDPTNRNIAYATYSTFYTVATDRHVYRSMDGGATWTPIDGTGQNAIPDIPVHCLVVDPNNTRRLFIGTDLGVFVTTDGGANWAVENTGFANVITESLSLNVVNGATTLYAFTHGRGAWKAALDNNGCNYTLAAAGRTFSAAGGAGSVNVATNPNSNCNWTTESNANWITVNSGASGSGAGNVAFTVAPNNGIGTRIGTIAIAGRSFTITQPGGEDLTAPTIAITNPVITETTATAINISGTAADNLGVAQVIWNNERGFSGTATGTTAWSIAGAPLRAGANRITVTALDAARNNTSAVITILSRPPDTPADSEAPTLAITAPTTEQTFIAPSNTLNLGGTAADNTAIGQIRWNNNRGGGGAATGTTTWTVANLPLQPGMNLLTVTAWDTAGNAKTAMLAVTFNPGAVLNTVAGNRTTGNSGDDGAALNAQLWLPRAVAVDNAGNLFIADTQNHRVRKVSPAGVITAFAGSGILAHSTPATVPALQGTLLAPRSLAIANDGAVYIADTDNSMIRKVTPDGMMSTVAGTGLPGYSGDNGPATAAQVNAPVGIVLDAAQANLYIADTSNHRIRRLNLSSGVITTVAGTGVGAFAGDGGVATSARISFPAGVALDSAGNLYIADQSNARIRRVNAADSVINTIVGTGVQGYNGDNIPATTAQINQIRLITLDAQNNLYIADQANHRVRKVAPDGVITTIAGTGTAGAGNDGNLATASQLSVPTGVAVDRAGNVYIADGGNQRIAVVSTYNALASASAASFAPGAAAPDSINVLFGAGLATATEAATTTPLPTTLAGTTVRVRDSRGVERAAPLFFVSAGQINYLLPAGLAPGFATVLVTNNEGRLATGAVEITSVAPGVFSANANGQGVPAAVAFRLKADGTQSFEPVARFDAAQNRFVATPLDLGPESDQVFLILFGTGFRQRTTLANVTATVGGVNAPVNFAGAAPGLFGLDQANLRLERSLVGRGEVDVLLTVDGKQANTVRVAIR